MCRDESVFRIMNAVLYYSATGQSERIARYIARKTEFEAADILSLANKEFDNAVIVFPVHCQNIPTPVKKCLTEITVKNLTVIATFGRMCHGNVLHEIQKRHNHNVVAAAYIPTRHSYLSDGEFDRFDELQAVLDKIFNPAPVTIPKSYKNPLSNVLQGWRSRVGVKIYRGDECDGCGICDGVCPFGAITKGKPNRKCIRCLACIAHCPKKALHSANRLPMRLYLKKKKTDKLEIFV